MKYKLVSVFLSPPSQQSQQLLWLQRMPGRRKRLPATRFAPGQVKRIMQQDEDVGRVVQAVPVMIARALELFTTQLLEKAGQLARGKGAKTLCRDHIVSVIQADTKLDFLLPLAQPGAGGEKNETRTNKSSGKKTKSSSGTGGKRKDERKMAVEQVRKKINLKSSGEISSNPVFKLTAIAEEKKYSDFSIMNLLESGKQNEKIIAVVAVDEDYDNL